MPTQSKAFRYGDLLLSLAIFAYGLHWMHAEWPDPSGWAWTTAVFGGLCVAAWGLNPVARIETFLTRRLVKTR